MGLQSIMSGGCVSMPKYERVHLVYIRVLQPFDHRYFLKNFTDASKAPIRELSPTSKSDLHILRTFLAGFDFGVALRVEP